MEGGTVTTAHPDTEPEDDRTRTHRVNAVPLLDTLTAIRELGRKRKESGIDDEAVQYARMASKAIAWFEADEEGSFKEAVVLLDELHKMLPD